MENTSLFQKPAWQAIFSLSIPSLISIVVIMLYNMADMYFVGWTGDMAQVGAVSMAAPLFSILTAVSTMIGNGGCTKIAQALGRKDTDRVRSLTALCVWGSLGLGLIFAAVCFLSGDHLIRLLGANSDMWDYTKSYALIMAAGAPAVLLNYSLGGILRGQGLVKISLAGNMISTFTNIVLDPIFILTLRLGVGGAAAATVIGNIAASAFYISYTVKNRKACMIELRPRYARNIRDFGSVLALGLPNAISSTLSGLAGTLGNRLAVDYGTEAVAAIGAAGKAVMLVTMVQMGICMGLQPLLAYCYGGKDWPRLKEVVVKTLLLTFVLGGALTLLCWFGRGAVIGLFIKTPEVAELGEHLVGYMTAMGPFIGIYYLSTNFLQAAGAAVLASVSSALRQGALLIPLLYLMNSWFNLDGLAAAHMVSDGIALLVTALMAFIYYRRVAKLAAR